VHAAFTDAGYEVGPANSWTQDVLTFRVSAEVDQQPTSVWVFVYPTTAAATNAHQFATYQDQSRLNRQIPDSDQRGPQLLSGFGASYWWRNIAMVQSARPGDLAAWPTEPDYQLVIIGTSANQNYSSVGGLPETVVSQQFIEVLEAAFA
jgi:hypothetical protein